MRILISIYIIFLGLSASAQTGNHIFVASFIDVFNSESGLKIKSIENNKLLSTGHVMSNYNGGLLFSFNNGNLISSDYSVLSNYQNAGNFSLNSSAIIKINDSSYYVFFEVLDTFINQIGIGHLDFIKVEITNNQLTFDSKNNVFTPNQVQGIVAIEDTIGGTWLVALTDNNQFTSYYFNDSCFGCISKVSNLNIKLANHWRKGWQPNKIIRSPSGNLIGSISKNLYMDSNLNIKEDLFYALYKFDKISGNVSFFDTIIYASINLEKDSFRFGITDFVISSNDSFAFSKIHRGAIENSYLSGFEILKYRLFPEIQSEQITFNLQKDSLSAFFNSHIGCLRFLSDGNLYVLTRDASKSSKSPSTLRCHQISNVNNSVKSEILHSKYVASITYSPSNLFLTSYSKYNYTRVSTNLNYQCDAKLLIENNSELSLPKTEVNFFIRNLNNKGEFLSIVATKPLSFIENGDYLLKVILKSEDFNYKEIHYDTINVRIPEKPVAAFAVSDTIACRFAPIQFFNQSSFSAVKPGDKVTYIWDFGDGESLQTSSTVPFSHAYAKAGTYSVSLTILNGYCDSTLMRTGFIRITEAPNPGFSVSSHQGCASFSVLLTDTVQHNVTRKEYFFSDVQLWKPVGSTQFSHIFDAPGHYYAVQRLYGNTGCITQTDTQYFFVSEGLSAQDTVHTRFASYLSNALIEIEWDTLEAAVQYALFKSTDGLLFPNQPMSISYINRFVDTIVSPGPLAYKIVGIDSCGGYSSSGRLAKPILLSGRATPDNSAAILSFTPYEQWIDTQINYTLSYLDNNQWVDLTEQPQSHSFEDHNFASSGAFEKCYRIKASNLSFGSLSNELCIPYMPFVFMPNAFSPNGDGINDTFKPMVYGLTSVKVCIYNRWGEKIKELSLGEAWQPENIMPGAFLVTFSGKANNGKDFFLSETLQVLR